MKTGSHLLAQLERCGLSAELAEKHREVGDDSSGARITRQEICRAWATKDQAQTQDAHAALCWLSSLGARNVYGVGEELDLVDSDGVVLVSGKPGAIIEQMDGEMLVVSWVVGDHFDAPEPEDDLGLLAMGLAVDIGKGFRVGHVYLKGGEAVCRRSNVFAPEAHPALWDRIRQATNRPRVACPGDWCGGCRQAQYCPAWLARARAALTVLIGELPEGSKLELTNDNASAFAERIKLVESAVDWAKDMRNAFAARGGIVIVNDKQLVIADCEGRETVDKEALKAALGDEAKKFLKRGAAYTTPRWQKPKATGVRR